MVAGKLLRLLMVAGQLVALSGSGGAQSFTDDPIVPGTTPVRAVHFTELRTRIDAVRVRMGLETYEWADQELVPEVTRVKLVHLTELRTALDQAYDAAGQTRPTYVDAVGEAGTTPIRAAHITGLRTAVVDLESARPPGPDVDIRAQYVGPQSPNATCGQGVTCIVGSVAVDEDLHGYLWVVARFYSSGGSLMAEASSNGFLHLVAGPQYAREFFAAVHNSALRGWDGWFTVHLALDGEPLPCSRCTNQRPEPYEPFGETGILAFNHQQYGIVSYVSMTRLGEQQLLELLYFDQVLDAGVLVNVRDSAVLRNSDPGVVRVDYPYEGDLIRITGIGEGQSTVTADYHGHSASLLATVWD